MTTTRTMQWSAVILAALVAGCSGSPSTSGVTKKKDIAALKKLMKSPTACGSASDCPTGSFCDDASRSCKIECFLSSHCGSEGACSADGHCIARASLSPAEQLAFASVSAGNRKLGDACVYDQECPNASYCDALDHVCRQDCASGGPTCAAGLACSPVGRCVDPTQLADLPQLSLSPGSVQLIRSGDSGTADQRVQRVLVLLKTTNKDLAAGNGVTPHVQVQPDAGVEVACPNPGSGATAPTSGFGQGCSLQDWSYTADASGGGFTAQREVWIRLGNVDPTLSQWSVAVRSREVSANIDHIVVVLPEPLRTSGFDGEYRGDLFLEGSQLAKTATSPALAQLSVPVTAVANAQGFLIFDPTGVAAPSGAFFYPLAGSAPYVETWVAARAATGTSTEPMADTGAVTATIARTTPDLAVVGDLVRGYINVSVAVSGTKPLKWRFELRRVGAPHAACHAGDSCGAGQTCDARLNACVPSGTTPAGAVTAGNTLVQQRMLKTQGDVAGRFAAAVSDRGNASTGDELADGMSQVPSIYTTQVMLPTVAGALLFDGADVSDTSALKKLGYNICARDFAVPSTVATIGGRTKAAPSASCTGSAPRVAVSTLTSSKICDQIYAVSDDFWNSCVAPTHTDAHGKLALRRSFVPCFAATDGSVPAAETCQNLYTIEFNGDTNYGTYDNFIAHSCFPAPASFYTPAGGEVEVYLCPEASRLAFGDSAANAELTACFDPSVNAGKTLLGSQRFGSSVTLSSGDIQCASSAPLAEVPLLDKPRDLSPNSTGSADDDAGAMYASCLAELSADVPSAVGQTPRAALGSALAPAHCINLPEFIASVETARQTFPNYYLDLLRRWVSLHAFVAQEGRVQWQSSRVLASIESGHAAEGSDAAIYDLLDRLDHGWDYVLAPANSDYLAGLRSYIVSNPDYRQGYHVPSNLPADHEQTASIAVALFDSLTQYLGVVDAYIEVAGTAAYADCQAGRPINADIRARVAASLRYTGAVERLTEMLALKNYTSAQTTKIARARAEFRSTMVRVVREASALLDCSNPLGISEGDLPLFFRDAQTTNNRYLASSDYLNTLLGPALNDATVALGSAQAAWDKARTTRIQAAATDNDFQSRLESLQAKYGTEIMNACGITDLKAEDVLAAFDPSNPNARNLDLCHLNAGCAGDASDPSCYRGTIGEAILTIRGANQDIDIAQRSWKDAQDSYDIEAKYCQSLEDDLKQDNVLTQEHDKTMSELRAEKETCDAITNFLDGAEKCASGAAASFGAACGPAIGEAITKTLSDSFANQMQEEDASYQAEMQERKNAREAAACFHEADLKHVGITTAQATIQRRGTDAALAMLRLRNLREHVQQQLTEGLAVVARERGRKLPSVAHHYWYDDAVVDFSNKMLRAKKLLFLFTQAVEYETQSSVASRPAIVQAIQPSQLSVVYNALTDTDTSYNTRTLHGRPVQAGVAVLSVCSELLGFSDPATTPFGSATCLNQFLASPQAALYDNSGKYLGQAVSFSLTSDHSDFEGLYGERVWYVSATASGETGMAQVPNGRLVVLKRDVFFDRWIPITGVGDGTPYQIGRTRPSGYLFDVQPGSSNQITDASSFLSTVLQPKWNMQLDQFSDPKNLPPGASDALAGRGIYGDYIVLFPATAPTDKNYVDLTKVDDLLLRFDFVAASYLNK